MNRMRLSDGPIVRPMLDLETQSESLKLGERFGVGGLEGPIVTTGGTARHVSTGRDSAR